MSTAPRKYDHLVKKMIWRRDPDNLYPFEQFWMEGKRDMEGFNGCFSYGFVKEEGGFLHPADGGMVVHPYNEVLAFCSINTDDILDLGAEISIEIGEEREVYTFDKTYVVCIPAGTPHGRIQVKNMKRPFVHFTISLAPEYSSKHIPKSELKAPVLGSSKYKGYARVFAWGVDPETGEALHTGGDPNKPMSAGINVGGEDGSGMGYTLTIDSRGVMLPRTAAGPGGMGPANADQMVWLYGDELQDFELNFLYGFYSHEGIFHRAGESHSHPCEEILITCGLDPDHPFETGCSMEIAMGEEDERHASEEPTIWVQPAGFSHLPQIVRWVDKPYTFMVVNLDGTHDSPWKDRDGSKTIYEK